MNTEKQIELLLQILELTLKQEQQGNKLFSSEEKEKIKKRILTLLLLL